MYTDMSRQLVSLWRQSAVPAVPNGTRDDNIGPAHSAPPTGRSAGRHNDRRRSAGRSRARGSDHRSAGRSRDRGRGDRDQPDSHSGQGFRDRALRVARQGSPYYRHRRAACRVRRAARHAGGPPDRLRTGRARGIRRRRRRGGRPPAERHRRRRGPHAGRRGRGGGSAGDTGARGGRGRYYRDLSGSPSLPARGGGSGGAGRGGGRSGRQADRKVQRRLVPGAGAAAGPGRRRQGRPGGRRLPAARADALLHLQQRLLPGRHRPGPAAGIAGKLDAADRRHGRAGTRVHLRRPAQDAADRERHDAGVRIGLGRSPYCGNAGGSACRWPACCGGPG